MIYNIGTSSKAQAFLALTPQKARVPATVTGTTKLMGKAKEKPWIWTLQANLVKM